MCLATTIYHILRPSTKPRPIRRFLIPIILSSCFLIMFLLLTVPSPTPFPTRLPPLPRCKNALIFTGARQGSTWFVDSIENCSYSTFTDGGRTRLFAKDVFKKTELWKHFGEIALDGVDMTPYDALEYIVSNTSVKIFPSVFWRRSKDIQTILDERHKYNLTILILRRNVEAAWDSWVRANASSVWNGTVKTANVTADENMHKYFVESRARYDFAVERLLQKLGVAYDVFDYDKAKKMGRIVARNNGCVIENCNFKTADNDAVGDDAVGEDAADAPE